tara:strand:- start:17854 stop:18030 length:177 start_codon:yes stop_codon:yes gene_type:complete
MSIGFGQLILILIVALLLLGKFPKLKEDLSNGLNNLKELIDSSKKKESNDNSQEKSKK